MSKNLARTARPAEDAAAFTSVDPELAEEARADALTDDERETGRARFVAALADLLEAT